MKVMKTLLAIGVMTTSFAPHAEVGLNFHRDLSPIIVDGEEMGYSLFSSSAQTLDNGTNQIVFRMAKLIENNGGEREKFNSHAFVLSFNAEDIDLRLEPDMRVLRESEGIEFNKNPKVKLVDEGGNNVDFTIDRLPAGDGLMRDYSKDLAHYNKTHGINTGNIAESSVAQVDAAVVATSPAVKVVTVKTGELEPASMIEYWMDKATPAENEQFVSWAFENRSMDKVSPIEGSQALNMLSYWYAEAKVEDRKQILAWLISQ
ncbi:hypothetical protein VII00023_11644 [Vibrio ichthyoenteri ATCC 700023]|uniref:Uncharacterized protein n=1 Tax=Vibrio ichthyoenteri ATCC 700023 TaxID=870968 RepID=F9RZI6_9VIBR|nr:DUF2057 domain-containing protein [Vibrio ichthyoenteri]EGU44849.1 hypothetical protein VII00023_11644 [Vibrio ichthyoenteri ATCC 700023]